MIVCTYNPERNAYINKDIVSAARNNNCDYTVEIHRNAFGSSSAYGYETLIKSGFSPDNVDLALHNFLKHGYFDRGFKYRSDLQNMNMMAAAGLGYSLVEIGFISNSNDNAIFDENLTRINSGLFDVFANAGVKRLLVVYGHGQGDPGATGYGRLEANDVRRIKVAQQPPAPAPTPFVFTDLPDSKWITLTDTTIDNYITGQKVADLPKGEVVDISAETSTGYLVSVYSHGKGIQNGIPKVAMKKYMEPTPPEPADKCEDKLKNCIEINEKLTNENKELTKKLEDIKKIVQ